MLGLSLRNIEAVLANRSAMKVESTLRGGDGALFTFAS
jgi:hypothetical protein